MFRKILVLFLLVNLFSLNGLYAQKEDIRKTVIAKVGDEEITYNMLEHAYNKNIKRDRVKLYNLKKDSLYDFLDLYINYRLKVRDAINRGYVSEESVQQEIKNNRKVLAESFFYDEKLITPYLDRAIVRRDTEAKVAVILKTYYQNGKQDTALARRQINMAMDELKEGKDFSEVAKRYSDDGQTAQKGGVVPGYITSGLVQRPLENAVYSTPEGEIHSEIIKSNAGFFIIKVLDKAPREKVHLSHILLKFARKDSMEIINRADSILKALEDGADFGKLAKKYSEDPTTASKGGSFDDPYSRSTGMQSNSKPFLPQFEKALFELEDGEVSDKIITDFGVHIIKRDSTAPKNKKAERAELKKQYMRLYYAGDKNELMDSLAREHGLKINNASLKDLVDFLKEGNKDTDDEIKDELPEDLSKKQLYSLMGKGYTVGDFIGQLNSEKAVHGFGVSIEGMTKAIYVMARPLVFEKATEDLEKDYPEFRRLMNEFKDGILLFKVEAEEVWDKLKFDTALARQYFDTLSKNYYTERKYDISEIYVNNDSIAKALYDKLQKGGDFDKVAADKTMRKGFREKEGHRGVLKPSREFLAQKAMENQAKEGDIIAPFRNKNGYSIIKINEVIPKRKKNFKEAIPDIAPTVQEIQQKKLTNKWLNKIKEDITVKIYEDKLNKVVNKLD